MIRSFILEGSAPWWGAGAGLACNFPGSNLKLPLE